MSSVVISGDTSGAITVAAPAVAGTNTITLPAVTGTAVIAGQNSAITSATAQTASSTAVNFTDIPSWVKRITVMFSGVSLSGTSDIIVQLGTSSGIVSSGYISTSVAQSSAPGTGASSSTSGFIIRGASASSVIYGHMFISLVTTNEFVSSHAGRQISNSIVVGGGNSSLGGTLDRIRITTVNGTDTFDAGTINILFE